MKSTRCRNVPEKLPNVANRVVYHGVTSSLVMVFCRYQIYWAIGILADIIFLAGTTFFLKRGTGPLKKRANAPLLRKKGVTAPLLRKSGVPAAILIPTKFSFGVSSVSVW